MGIRGKEPLKASTVQVYVQSVVSFTKFSYLHPEHLKSKIPKDEILQWNFVAENCAKTFAQKRATRTWRHSYTLSAPVARQEHSARF